MIRSYLPSFLSIPLFGNRSLYGKSPWKNDKDWEKWQSIYPEVYYETQRKGGIQKIINDKGYKILEQVYLQDKTVAEIGPGGGYHLHSFKGTPRQYNVLDVCKDFFPNLQEKAAQNSIPLQCYLLDHGTSVLPLDSCSQDIVLSFYSLEHLDPLDVWLKEIHRVLRPEGIFVGAVPVEGGFAWGLGRYLSSRRILKNKFDLDIRKIVCWEHPNMIDEIIEGMDAFFQKVFIHKFPFPFFPLDFNLIAKFIAYKK